MVVNSVVAKEHSTASLQVSVACSNDGPFRATDMEVSVNVTDAGQSVAHATTSIVELHSNESTTVILNGLKVMRPRLWDLSNPHLYLATVTLADHRSKSVHTVYSYRRLQLYTYLDDYV